MARLNPSGDATLSIKCSDELIDQIDDVADASQYSSRSSYIRAVLAESVEDKLGGIDSEDSSLSNQHEKAVQILKKNSGPRSRIPTEDAKGLLSTQLGVPKTSIKRSVLTPLEDAGMIQPHWGTIKVKA